MADATYVLTVLGSPDRLTKCDRGRSLLSIFTHIMANAANHSHEREGGPITLMRVCIRLSLSLTFLSVQSISLSQIYEKNQFKKFLIFA